MINHLYIASSPWLSELLAQSDATSESTGGVWQSLLKWLTGSQPDQVGDPVLVWGNFPESWGVFVLIAVIAAIVFAVFWAYRREINTCPMRIKLTMAALRLATLLMLVALFLKPSIVYQEIEEIKPTIVSLRDSSISFGRGDTYRDKKIPRALAETTGFEADEIANGTVTRSALMNAAVNKNPKLLEAIRDKGSVRVIDFGDGLSKPVLVPAITRQTREAKARADKERADAIARGDTPDEDPTGGGDATVRETMPDLNPTGFGTDIWQALRAGLDGSEQLSAIWLTTDGQHNGSEDPVEMAQKAASIGVPIFVVGVGDPNPPKNLAVNEVYVRAKAYPGEQFEIEALLQASQPGESGMPSQLPVQLLQQRVDPQTGKLDAAEQVQTLQVDVPANGGRMRVDFGHQVALPGNYVYTVKLDPLEDETESTDNQLASSVLEVVDEKVRVLLISGLPSWDYQQVQRLLQRDSSVSLTCWLQSMDESRPQEGNLPISRLPQNRLELSEYNVIMMMDPDPQEFTAEWIDLLEEFCRQNAGGVMYMAGPHFTSEFMTVNRLKTMRSILPVRFGDTEFIDTTQAIADAVNAPGKMLLVNHNMDHPVMSFRADQTETQKVWAAMPGIYWSFPALAPKPTARVLLERGDQSNAEGNQPLMVSGRLGSGSVLYMGFQGTWRWRPLGLQAQFFDTFWIQVVRFLVENRSLQGSRRGFIDTDLNQYELGDRVMFISRITDEEFKPSTQPSYQALVKSEDGRIQKIEMKLLPNQEGRYEGSFVAQRTGNYSATIDLGEASEKLIDPISFFIVPPSAESNSFWLNEKLLREIATQSGGQYFDLTQLDQLSAALPVLNQKTERNTPPKPIWDVSFRARLIAFLFPVFLLTIEWALRKYFKLL